MGKFCVIDCEKSPVWQVPESFGTIFRNKLSLEGDEWDIIKVALGDSVPDPTKYDGVVLTGSHYNCRDGDTLCWFDDLCAFIKYSYDHGTPRIYGGCFGCQIIAHALGGTVDYNPNRRFLCKVETIQPVDRNCFCASLGDLPCELGNLKVIVSHGDCVRVLPPEDAVLIASSSSCENEIFMIGKDSTNRNILGCQSHPEFEVNYCIWERIWPIAVIKNGRLSEDEISEYEPSLRKYDPGEGADVLIRLIQQFLHKPAPQIASPDSQVQDRQ